MQRVRRPGIEADPKGASLAVEREANKEGGGKGWADVWKRGRFGWDYKGRYKSLQKSSISSS